MATIPTLTALDEAGASLPAERATLKAFLHQHPVVHQLLVEAEAPLRAAFGPEVTLALTVETDPEIPGWDYLVASIQTPVPVEQRRCAWPPLMPPGGWRRRRAPRTPWCLTWRAYELCVGGVSDRGRGAGPPARHTGGRRSLLSGGDQPGVLCSLRRRPESRARRRGTRPQPDGDDHRQVLLHYRHAADVAHQELGELLFRLRRHRTQADYADTLWTWCHGPTPPCGAPGACSRCCRLCRETWPARVPPG